MGEGKESTKYLYGASIQGIQGFIFQTDKLKEIVGASELVAQICTTAFNDYALNGESIVRAAGNIKYIFNHEKDCKEAVLRFPRKVMTMAPGITISQAVVKVETDLSNYAAQSDKLEQLLRAQRNKLPRPMTLGLMAIKRAPSTGLPAMDSNKEGLIDEASEEKTKNNQTTKDLMLKLTGKDKLKHEQIAYDFEDMEGKNSWLAVVHADGNGMGRIFEAVGKYPYVMRIFSTLVDEITASCAQESFGAVQKEYFAVSKTIPIRPIVLSGDDLTIVCRADLAIDYTKVFIETFESLSKKMLEDKELKADKDIKPEIEKLAKNLKSEIGKLAKEEREKCEKMIREGLTVCAGIAFVKSSYPFHYAYNLAEKLCSRAKKAAKKIDTDLAPSCMMFHKVQDSFVEDFSEIVERELKPQPNLSFENGPYYCGEHAQSGEKCKNNCLNTVDSLLRNIKQLKGKEGNAIKSHLRQWLSLLFENVGAADQKMKRLRTLDKKAYELIDDKYEKLSAGTTKEIPFHDILSLASILYINTKKQEEKQ
jgi:hypothetical protein